MCTCVAIEISLQGSNQFKQCSNPDLDLCKSFSLGDNVFFFSSSNGDNVLITIQLQLRAESKVRSSFPTEMCVVYMQEICFENMCSKSFTPGEQWICLLMEHKLRENNHLYVSNGYMNRNWIHEQKFC